MPRFYFHLHYPAEAVRDEEGIELPDVKAAEREAIGAVRDIASEDLRGDGQFELLGIRITDGEGNLVSVVLSRDALAKAISGNVWAMGIDHAQPFSFRDGAFA